MRLPRASILLLFPGYKAPESLFLLINPGYKAPESLFLSCFPGYKAPESLFLLPKNVKRRVRALRRALASPTLIPVSLLGLFQLPLPGEV